MATPPAPAVDLVTALQEALGRVNGVLFNYVGALQRDAPPVSLKGEALMAPPKTYDVQAQAEVMARDLTAALQEVEQLVQRLPPIAASSSGGGGEEQDIARAVDLLRQNAEASEELQGELAAASAKLAQLQDAYGALAEAALAHKAAAAAAAATAAAAEAAAGKGGGDGS